MKAIAVLRVSTDRQEIEDQRDELYSFIKANGYSEIIPIEAVGASAIKMDDRYLYMVQSIKKAIQEDSEINAVFVWELSRLGRNEMVLMEFKEFFIKNHIQFVCKNPSMKLLNDDGSLNSGMELAFSLFATMSKQEMEEKKARFRRARISMLKKGQYIGGHTIKFGYKVVDGFFEPDEEESEIVKNIFYEYSTGKHSSYTLAKELQDQGIGLPEYAVCNILKCRAYLGEEVGEYGMYYPPIISREIFDRCEKIRQENKIMMKRVDNIHLGSKLVKCPVCGSACTSNSKHYRCSRNAHHGHCDNKFALNQEVADELLYRNAFGLHLKWLIDIRDGRIEEYRKNLKIVDEKIESANKKIENFDQKKERIVESYMEGLIDKKNRDLRLKKLEDDVKFQRDFLNQLQDKRRAIMGLLETDENDTIESFIKAAKLMGSENKFYIVHKHIEKLVAYREDFGKKDRRSSKPRAVHIVITTLYGVNVEYMYIPHTKGCNLYILIDGEWVEDSLERKAVYAMPLD